MRNTLPAFVVTGLLILSSCRESPRAFADKFIDAENTAWGTGDLEPLKAIEDLNVAYHLPGGVELKSWKPHEDFIVNGRKNASNLRQQWGYLSGEGNLFVLSYASSAVIAGNRTSNNYLFVFRTQGGKIVEVWANGCSSAGNLK
jgi:ketosteroid isomerase-like protein